jgi:hypothetical protein
MSRVHPTVRGLAIVFLIAGVVTALQLDDMLAALFLVVQIAFLLAIAYFLYVLWKRNRSEISTWSARAQAVLYGAVVLAIADVVVAFVTSYPETGLEALVFFAVLAAAGFSIWRVWRDAHTYGY